MKITTYSKKSDKSALQSAGMVLGIEPSKIDELTKSFPTIDEVPNSFHGTDTKELVEIAHRFLGRLGAYGTHASAVLVSPMNVLEFCPVQYQSVSDESLSGAKVWTEVACGDFHDLENFGLLKEDVLGLGTLDVINDTLKLIDKDIDIYNLPTDDPKVLELYKKGELLGCFQCDSAGMRKVGKDMKVSKFSDIISMIALYRPAPIQSGMLDAYIKGKNGAKVNYPCEEIKEVLSETYGVIEYQEQVIQLAQKMGGYSLGQADNLRRIIGRKEKDKAKQATQELKEAMLKRGFDKKIVDDICVQILNAAQYIFNKSHATAYAYLSYVTAYLKVYYPREFMCSLINSKKKQEDVVPYVNECAKMRIPILPPDLRKQNKKWQVEKGGIRVGLTYIRNVGVQLDTDYIDSYHDIIEHNNKRIVEGLIKSGAIDYLGLTRAKMLNQLTSTKDFIKRKKFCEEKIAINQQKVASAKDEKEAKKYTRLLNQWKEKLEQCTLEISTEYAQIPDSKLEMEVLKFNYSDVPRIKEATITSVKLHLDKKGRQMAFVTFETMYGDYDCTVFARAWKYWKKNMIVGAKCKIACNNSQNPILEDFILR